MYSSHAIILFPIRLTKSSQRNHRNPFLIAAVMLCCALTVIVALLNAHAKMDRMVRRGAYAVRILVTSERDFAEELVAQGARAVLEAIEADPDISAKVHSAVQEALAELR